MSIFTRQTALSSNLLRTLDIRLSTQLAHMLQPLRHVIMQVLIHIRDITTRHNKQYRERNRRVEHVVKRRHIRISHSDSCRGNDLRRNVRNSREVA